MPRLPSKEYPENLRPYIFHGIDLNYDENDKEAIGDCPFCYREDKFSIEIETSQSRCFVCGESMNARTFLKKLHSKSIESSNPLSYERLANERGLSYPETLIHWEVGISPIDRTWLVPGYSLENKVLKLGQLYRYITSAKRKLLLPTPGFGHKMFGLNLYDPNKLEVFLCEGPWDAMVLWETLRRVKVIEDGSFSSTANIDKSILADANVLAVPGCGTFFEDWTNLFEDAIVHILYDSDKPKDTHGKIVPPAGLNGVKRVAKILSEAKQPPESINYLCWGEEGYDESLPSGYDIRDLLNQDGVDKRINQLPELYNRLKKVPKEWLSSQAKKKAKVYGSVIECLKCETYKQVVTAWRKALKWTDGLDAALCVMLSSAMSTNQVGEQLWFKILGPPSSGKTTLLEGLAINKKYVLSKDTIRGFYSGWKSSDGEDHSIAALCKGKTLATKDGDTLLKSPNLAQILSEARGLYDRCGRTHYRNTVAHEYEGHRMTWLLCGTNALREIDDSELGARFLDCVIMDTIDEEFEDDVAWRVANQEANAMLTASNGEPANQNPETLTKAMQLTGGYLDYLRENVTRLLKVPPPEILKRCTRYAKFVSIMRARPSKTSSSEADAEREFSARLTKLLVRLCGCVVVVLNRKSPDVDVMKIVRKITLDTSRGQGLEITRSLYKAEEGLALSTISVYTEHTDYQTGKMLRFLHRLNIVKTIEIRERTTRGTIRKLKRWDLTDSTRNLYRVVMNDA